VRLTNKQLIIELRQLIWGSRPSPRGSILHAALWVVVEEIEKRLVRSHEKKR